MSSQLEEFLDSMANECDEKTLRTIKAKEIFYQVSGGVAIATPMCCHMIWYLAYHRVVCQEPGIPSSTLWPGNSGLVACCKESNDVGRSVTCQPMGSFFNSSFCTASDNSCSI